LRRLEVAAIMAKPGVVLKRPVGSNGPFKEHAELPTNLGDVTARPSKAARKPAGRKTKKTSSRPTDKAMERKAAVAYEREQKRRDRERAREEAARQKEREHRQQAVDKAQSALDEAKRKHAERTGAIQAEADAIEKRAQAENARWKKEKERLDAALQRARLSKPGARKVSLTAVRYSPPSDGTGARPPAFPVGEHRNPQRVGGFMRTSDEVGGPPAKEWANKLADEAQAWRNRRTQAPEISHDGVQVVRKSALRRSLLRFCPHRHPPESGEALCDLVLFVHGDGRHLRRTSLCLCRPRPLAVRRPGRLAAPEIVEHEREQEAH
jgi:hypothetical protein